MVKRVVVYLLSYLLAIAPALGSQNALLSPTTGTVSGLNLTNNYNNALDSLNTMNSGASAPTNQLSGVPSLGNWWMNTTANPYPAQVYDGADWLAPFYVDASNHLILNQVGGGTATIASATTTSICSDPQYFITISGTVTITGLGTGCFTGQSKKITFSGALLLTYNATSLIIPGAANVTTSAGDTADAIYLGSGDWQIVDYQPANGQALINPAIDVGAIEWTFSPNIPSSKYLWAYGQAVSRSTYSVLETALTITQSVTATNGSPTLTGFSDTTEIPTGAVVEASFLSAPTTISSCTSTTCIMAANANASTTANATVFPYGDGCGAGTACLSVGSNFNLPNCAGEVLAGRPNMSGTGAGNLTSTYYGTNPNALGAIGGNQDTALASTGQLPQFTPSGSVSTSLNSLSLSTATVAGGSSAGGVAQSGAGGSSGFTFSASLSSSFSGNPIGSGSPTPFRTIQPTITANCMIRVLAMFELRGAPSFNDNDQLAAIEPRRPAA
jgi:hypothetical protein